MKRDKLPTEIDNRYIEYPSCTSIFCVNVCLSIYAVHTYCSHSFPPCSTYKTAAQTVKRSGRAPAAAQTTTPTTMIMTASLGRAVTLAQEVGVGGE